MCSPLYDIKQPIVFDIGSYSVNLGYSDVRKLEPDYKLEWNSIDQFIGKKPVTVVKSQRCNKELLVDNDIHVDNGYPVENLLCSELVEILLSKYLKINVAEHPMLVVESAQSSSKSRNIKLEMFFEEIGTTCFALSNEALLSLYATGRHTGVVIVSGHSHSYCCAIHEGITPPYGILPMNVTGSSLTDLTAKLLGNDVVTKERENICQQLTRDQAHILKETQGRVGQAHDATTDIGLTVGEVLFDSLPQKDNTHNKGIHTTVEEVIYAVDELEEFNHRYYENIVLSGGNTLFPGIEERLTMELERTKVDKNAEVIVVAVPNRRYLPWVGGSIVSSLPSFKHHWILKADYEEYGSSVFNRKCLPYL